MEADDARFQTERIKLIIDSRAKALDTLLAAHKGLKCPATNRQPRRVMAIAGI